MPKNKVKRHGTNIDMTAMCDVAFLLLTFFMLTTRFRPQEAVIVDIPSSIATEKMSEKDLMLITISAENKVYFSIDGAAPRLDLINKINEKFNLGLTDPEKANFVSGAGVSVPRGSLKQYLDIPAADAVKVKVPGIPVDSTNNELRDWIQIAAEANTDLNVGIKGDVKTSYPVVDKVIKTLTGLKMYKVNFVTDLE
nr:biopolymer transporter ExbD [Saprospiraceae bacterium]